MTEKTTDYNCAKKNRCACVHDVKKHTLPIGFDSDMVTLFTDPQEVVMSSKKAKSANPQAAQTIDVHDKSAFRHWCKEFGCTEKELSAAARAVGGTSSAVKEYIESHH